jgi:hypothetical protein
VACRVGLRVRDAGEGDFEAEGAELADVVGDLAADVALAVVVVGAEVVVAGAGLDSSACRTLSWVLPRATWAFGCAAAAGDAPVAGAFAGGGLGCGYGGLAEDGTATRAPRLARIPCVPRSSFLRPARLRLTLRIHAAFEFAARQL